MALAILLLAAASATSGGAVQVDEASKLDRPVLTTTEPIPYPAGAPALTAPVEVTVRLRVDVDGRVTHAELVSGAGAPFDGAVLEAVARFVFIPARYEGQPVAVDLDFTQTFEPVARPERSATAAVIEGAVVERGTRRPVAGATVELSNVAGQVVAATDPNGRFRARVAPGELEVRVVLAGYLAFVQHETVEAGQGVAVKYLLERESFDPYETVVITTNEREEISRVRLRDREIHQMPGSFGDPFRVVSTLPSMTDFSVLIPMTMARGSSPSATGFLLDGVELPMLYHVLAGPAVIHPELVSAVDVYPGGFPVSFGGFSGGIVNGITSTSRSTTTRREVDLTVTQAGFFVREPFETAGTTVTAAARVGYPGLLMRAVSESTSLGYWDYQARVDRGVREDGWSAVVFGAGDHLERRREVTTEAGNPVQPRWETVLDLGFHRADIRWWHESGRLRTEYLLVGGFEQTELRGLSRRSWLIAPQARWTVSASQGLELRLGLEGRWRELRSIISEAASADDRVGKAVRGVYTSGSAELSAGGAYGDAVWDATEELRLTVGARADVYHSRYGDMWGVDPRLTARCHVFGSDSVGGWVKAAVGWFHQPPRPFVPLPGGSLPTRDDGLSSTMQSSLGFELALGRNIDVDVEAYYDALDPIYGEPTFNAPFATVEQPPNTTLPTVDEDWQGGQVEPDPRVGRSYGLEILLRHRDGGDWFGWVSYALAKSERRSDAQWVPFDFDVRHRLSVVLGARVMRGWELAGRVSISSGYPVTTAFGQNEGSLPAESRIDLRIDKRAVWNDWMLDFYVDIVNAAVNDQTLIPGERSVTRFFLPTAGMRALF